MKKLLVRGRYLAWEDGAPFFYLADTAWELFHRLGREDAAHYLQARSRQGFTAVQAVALAEKDGLCTPNAHGRLPFLTTNGLPDPDRPDTGGPYSYWDHVDYIVDTAGELGLFAALLPTWGDKYNKLWGDGPEIFNAENARRYGKWIAQRYADRENIIWMLGGDRPLEEKHRAIIAAMAAGIREADENHLITFHPCGASCSTDALGDPDYIDFHTAQSGHAANEAHYSVKFLEKMAAASPKPFLDSEPRYEDHPANFKPELGVYWNADDVRVNAYWSVLGGACGHTYGNHNVWSMNREPGDYFPYHWAEALVHPGAEQMRHVRKLRLSREYFSLQPKPEILCDQYFGMGTLAAAQGAGYAFVYTPLGLPFTLDLSKLQMQGVIRALWFDPRTGGEEIFTILPTAGKMTFAPPTSGKGCDWVLILDEIC